MNKPIKSISVLDPNFTRGLQPKSLEITKTGYGILTEVLTVLYFYERCNKTLTSNSCEFNLTPRIEYTHLS